MRIEAGSVIPCIKPSASDRRVPFVRAKSVGVDASVMTLQYDVRSLNVCAYEDADAMPQRRTTIVENRANGHPLFSEKETGDDCDDRCIYRARGD